MRILDRKIDAIVRSRASKVVTGCPGCIIQLRSGIYRHRMEIEVEPLVTLARSIIPDFARVFENCYPARRGVIASPRTK